MILYGDTSALVKALVAETGSETVLTALNDAETLVATSIGFVELRAAIYRARRRKRLSDSQYAETLRRADEMWANFEVVGVTDPIIQRAALAANDHGLRALDAIHLAGLQTLRPEATTLACWDQDLRQAAADLGYRLIPDTID